MQIGPQFGRICSGPPTASYASITHETEIDATAQGGWPEKDGRWNEQVCEEDITYQTTGGACMLPLGSCNTFATYKSSLLKAYLCQGSHKAVALEQFLF